MSKHTPAAEQGRLFARWRGTDTSLAAFAREHGLNPKTFGRWVARHPPLLPVPPAVPGFVRVVVPTPPRTSPEVSVVAGGYALCFHGPPPAGWFAAVVRELWSC